MEQLQKITELKLKTMALKLKYELAKEQYEKAQEIEKLAEEKALARYNKENGTNYIDSCEFVKNETEFNKCLQFEQEEYAKLGIEKELNKVYTYEFMKNFVKSEKEFLMTSVEFLRLFGKENEAETFEKLIKTYIPNEFKQKLIGLIDNFIGIKGE